MNRSDAERTSCELPVVLNLLLHFRFRQLSFFIDHRLSMRLRSWESRYVFVVYKFIAAGEWLLSNSRNKVCFDRMKRVFLSGYLILKL